MRGAVKYVLNKESLQGLSVAVKGIGKVDTQLVHYLLKMVLNCMWLTTILNN